MLAYSIDRSKIGDYGFDKLNIYTNDEIYCSGFTPEENEIDQLGHFIEKINRFFDTQTPVSLFISLKSGMYHGDLKILGEEQPIVMSAKAYKLNELINRFTNDILFHSAWMSTGGEEFNDPMEWVQ